MHALALSMPVTCRGWRLSTYKGSWRAHRMLSTKVGACGWISARSSWVRPSREIILVVITRHTGKSWKIFLHFFVRCADNRYRQTPWWRWIPLCFRYCSSEQCGSETGSSWPVCAVDSARSMLRCLRQRAGVKTAKACSQCATKNNVSQNAIDHLLQLAVGRKIIFWLEADQHWNAQDVFWESHCAVSVCSRFFWPI